MKTKLLILFCFLIFSVNAQTTHFLDWQLGALSPVTDLTIATGDTVVWEWTDLDFHTVENVVGFSVETFNSTVLIGIGTTYMYTFTVVGTNDYKCGVHGAVSMSGTITVQTLGVEDFSLKSFTISPNPSSFNLNIELPNNITNAKVEVYDVLGKRVYIQELNNLSKPIDVTRWNSGVYLVKVSNEVSTQTKRFIKQ